MSAHSALDPFDSVVAAEVAVDRFVQVGAVLEMVGGIAGREMPAMPDPLEAQQLYRALTPLGRDAFAAEAREAADFAAAGVGALLAARPNSPGRITAAAELARALRRSMLRMTMILA